MNESIDNPIQEQIETIYAEDSAYVEDFRIRPKVVEDDGVEMRVMIRIGGGEAVYHLRSSVGFAAEESGHEIRIERRGGELVDEFETEVVTAAPTDLFDAVQAIHDTYVSAYEDWYCYAIAADEAVDEA